MPYQSTWNNPYLNNPLQPMVTGNSLAAIPYQVQPQATMNGITKVNGPNSALQYNMPPNSTSPALFDYNGKVFYIVSTDGTGMKSLETFDYKEHVEESPVVIDGVEFVNRREFDELAAKVNVVIGALNGLQATVPATERDGQPTDAQGDGSGQPAGTVQ